MRATGGACSRCTACVAPPELSCGAPVRAPPAATLASTPGCHAGKHSRPSTSRSSSGGTPAGRTAISASPQVPGCSRLMWIGAIRALRVSVHLNRRMGRCPTPHAASQGRWRPLPLHLHHHAPRVLKGGSGARHRHPGGRRVHRRAAVVARERPALRVGSERASRRRAAGPRPRLAARAAPVSRASSWPRSAERARSGHRPSCSTPASSPTLTTSPSLCA